MDRDVTYLEELYDEFLSSISDYTMLMIDDEELEEDLFSYFIKARRKFIKCRQRLDILSDDDGNKYFGYKEKNKDGSITEVDVRLTDYEIAILAHLMLVEYMKPIMLSTEVTKQSLSDKDFKVHSQANQLRELNLLYRLLRRESNKMITEYTYIGMTDNDKR